MRGRESLRTAPTDPPFPPPSPTHTQRVVNAYTSRYLNPSTCVPNALLHVDAASGGKYTVSGDADVASVRASVDTLPALDPPDLFGLHASAELAFRGGQAKAALGVLASLRPKAAAATGASSPAADARDRSADAAAAGALAKLPPPFAPADVKAGLARHPGGATAPLATCLRQEAERLSAALASARDDLTSVRSALAGAAAMTPPLAAAAAEVADGRPPPSWAKQSWEAASLAGWVASATARAAQIAAWLASGPPRAFWLPGLANPGTFFTAVKQDAARAAPGGGWALDDVTLSTSVMHPPATDAAALPATPPDGGVYVTGLWLDGAAWDARTGKLTDPADARKGGPTPLPAVLVRVVRCDDARAAAAAAASFDAPIYRGPTRGPSGLVGRVSLRCDGGSDKWALRGVALLCASE